MRPRAVLAVLLTPALLLLAACDGSGDGDTRASTSSSTRPRATTTSRAPATTTTGGGATTSSTADPTPTTAPPSGGCGPQTSIIVDAIGGSEQLAGRAGSYTVAQCRLAASSPIWAAAEIVPNPGASIGPATVLLERIGSIWTVAAFGTGSVGCPAPAAVRAELLVTC